MAAAAAVLLAHPPRAAAQAARAPTAGGRQSLEAFLRQQLSEPNTEPDSTTRFISAALPVQGKQSDYVVYVSGQTWCGTGGCLLLVLESTASTYRVLGRTTITGPPIRVLRSTHHGLPDLSVVVAGGGIRPPNVALLAFDGVRYPSNPTLPPARRASVAAAGRVLIRGDAEHEQLYPRSANSMSTPHSTGCDVVLPSDVSAFVRSEARRGWNVVTLGDLVADDQTLWSRSRAGRCPGIAVGRFDGTARDSYAIALLRRGGRVGQYVEQLVLLRPSCSTYSRLVVSHPTPVVSPFVVWSLPPGTYTGVEDTAHVALATDSFVYEKLEASAVQYYLIGGRLHSLVTAD